MSFLFNGVVEQNYIAHVMAYSTCIGPYDTVECRDGRENTNGAVFSKSLSNKSACLLEVLAFFVSFFYFKNLL